MVTFIARGLAELVAEWARLMANVTAHPFRTLTPGLVRRGVRNGSARDRSLTRRSGA